MYPVYKDCYKHELLLLENTARKIQNGHFYQNANWREMLVDIFERSNLVQLQMYEAPAEQEANGELYEAYNAEKSTGMGQSSANLMDRSKVCESTTTSPGLRRYLNFPAATPTHNRAEPMSVLRPFQMSNDNVTENSFLEPDQGHDPVSTITKTSSTTKLSSTITKKASNSDILDGIVELVNNDGNDDVLKATQANATITAIVSDDEDDNILKTKPAVGPIQSFLCESESSYDEADPLRMCSPTTRFVKRTLAKIALNGASSSMATSPDAAALRKAAPVGPPYKCYVCFRSFNSITSVRTHLQAHISKPHACGCCERCFATSGELVCHLRYSHTFEKPHKCLKCDYASFKLTTLKLHIRNKHTKKHNFKCTDCEYGAPYAARLKRHSLVHTSVKSVKSFKCDVCRARFPTSTFLKMHKLSHVNKRAVFKCKLCRAAYARETDLKMHIQKLHVNPSELYKPNSDTEEEIPDMFV